MKILFLHPNIPDYAGDGLFHGLRQILGENVVDYPRIDYMYADYQKEKWKGIANEGKVLYGLLHEPDGLKEKRKDCFKKLSEFSCFVISNPSAFGKGILNILKKINIRKNAAKIAWVDGSDTQRFFPFASIIKLFLSYPGLLFTPVQKGRYFKREFGGFQNAAPAILRIFCYRYNLHPLSISIPEIHIAAPDALQKEKDYPDYIVDAELAEKERIAHGPLGVHQFVFREESAYWKDIEKSRFGPTSKRGGWDALRHYEYAAKGAVLCFKDFAEKPTGCSPYGLNASNSICYSNYKELQTKINNLNKEQYHQLQQQNYIWICSHTTIAEAQRFLNIVQPIHNAENA